MACRPPIDDREAIHTGVHAGGLITKGDLNVAAVSTAGTRGLITKGDLNVAAVLTAGTCALSTEGDLNVAGAYLRAV